MQSLAIMLQIQTCLLPSRDKAMNHRHHPFIQEISHHLFTFLQKLLYLIFYSLTKNVVRLPSQSNTYLTILGCLPLHPISVGWLILKGGEPTVKVRNTY